MRCGPPTHAASLFVFLLIDIGDRPPATQGLRVHSPPNAPKNNAPSIASPLPTTTTDDDDDDGAPATLARGLLPARRTYLHATYIHQTQQRPATNEKKAPPSPLTLHLPSSPLFFRCCGRRISPPPARPCDFHPPPLALSISGGERLMAAQHCYYGGPPLHTRNNHQRIPPFCFPSFPCAARTAACSLPPPPAAASVGGARSAGSRHGLRAAAVFVAPPRRRRRPLVNQMTTAF